MIRRMIAALAVCFAVLAVAPSASAAAKGPGHAGQICIQIPLIIAVLPICIPTL